MGDRYSVSKGKQTGTRLWNSDILNWKYSEQDTVGSEDVKIVSNGGIHHFPYL